MKEDVGLQRSHEEKRRRARVSYVDDAGRGGALEVVGDGSQGATGRAGLVARIERQHDRGAGALMHVDRDVFADRLLQKGNRLRSQPPENDAGIVAGVRSRQFENEVGRGHARRTHRLGEKSLLAVGVAEQSGGRHLQLAGNVGERCGLESLLGEDPSRGLQELMALDRRRAAHL
jgi:hypothetical protein